MKKREDYSQMINWEDFKHFSKEEFNCPCCGKNEMQSSTIGKLEYLRSVLGKPVAVTSGYRCTEYNKRIGGAENSAHTRGYAADCICTDNAYRYRFISEAIAIFKRFGIYDRHIHVDNDPNKTNEIIWYGRY